MHWVYENACMSINVWMCDRWVYGHELLECMSMNVWMCETIVYKHECMSMNVRVCEHVALCESRSWICPRLYRRPRHVVTPWLIKVDWLLHFASARASKNLVGFCNDARCLVLWVIDVNLRPDLNGEPMDSMHHQLLPAANFSQHNGENPLCPKSEGKTRINFQSLSMLASAQLFCRHTTLLTCNILYEEAATQVAY